MCLGWVGNLSVPPSWCDFWPGQHLHCHSHSWGWMGQSSWEVRIIGPLRDAGCLNKEKLLFFVILLWYLKIHHIYFTLCVFLVLLWTKTNQYYKSILINNNTLVCVYLFVSVKRSSCYMVCASEGSSLSHSRNSSGLEIGCLVDTATGLLTFTANGKALATYYQVNISSQCLHSHSNI